MTSLRGVPPTACPSSPHLHGSRAGGRRPQAFGGPGPPGSPGPPRPPILVLQSRAISFYIFRRMLGRTVSFPIGLLRSNCPNLLLSCFTALGSGLESRFPTSLHSNTTMLIWGGTISFYRSSACFRGVLTDVRHGSRNENTVRRSYVLYIYIHIHVCTP